MTGTLTRILSQALSPSSSGIRARRVPMFADAHAPVTDLAVSPMTGASGNAPAAEPADAFHRPERPRPAQKAFPIVAESVSTTMLGVPTDIRRHTTETRPEIGRTTGSQSLSADIDDHDFGAGLFAPQAPSVDRETRQPSHMDPPRLLLPEALRPPREAPVHLPAAPASSEPPDIEISIGRIEVRTEGNEAPAQHLPPAPAPTSSFISLDDYLKTRRAS